MLLTHDHGTRCEILLRTLSSKPDLTRPDEITEKNTAGITELLKYSNGLELHLMTCTVATGILVDMSGEYLRRFAQRVN